MSVISYHKLELQIALDPSDPRHVLPLIRPHHRRILDVGCGMGQTLMALHVGPKCQAWGVDVDAVAVAAGLKMVPDNIHLAVAAGENLPFPDRHFDFVFSRGSLPYMHLSQVMSEIERVLDVDGEFWATMHPPKYLLRRLYTDLVHFNVRAIFSRIFVSLNGMILAIFGLQIRLSGSCETVQTKKRMRRLIEAAGLRPLPFEHSRSMIIRATKKQR
jgi:ubiquinone/menaquinone biosynthesis C-methylase UbiE